MSARPPERIALLQLQYLGDVLLATPAIRAARQTFPNARIDFITLAPGGAALEGNPHLDNILVEPRLGALFRTRYDVAVDMQSMPRSALYVAATRARQRIGVRGRGPRNLVYTKLLDRQLGGGYMARQKLRLLASLGIDAERSDTSLEIAIDEQQRSWARSKVAGLNAPIVAISPVSRLPEKQWGASRWAGIADSLMNAGASVILTGGPSETEQVDAVVRAMTREPFWRYGKTTIRQLAALYAQCTLWLGNDGGPKHIAAAAGTPTITIYRKRNAGVWSDGTDRQVAIESDTGRIDGVLPGRVLEAAFIGLDELRR